MDETEIEKITDEKFNDLPRPLQDTLTAPAFDTAIARIGGRHNLSPEAEDKLDNCVTFVILGLSHPKDFIRTVKDTVGVDNETAGAIAQEVNEQIFRPVRDELRALYNIEDVPSKKPLDVELSENVGLKPPPPPPPMLGRPLDAELQDTLRGRAPAGAFNSGQRPPVPPAPPSDSNEHWRMPAPPAPPTPPQRRPVPPMPPARTFVNPMADATPEAEESLSREEILRGIENPGSITGPSSGLSRGTPQAPSPRPQPPGNYETDPYREPLE